MIDRATKKRRAVALAALVSATALVPLQAKAAPWSFVPVEARNPAMPVPVTLIVSQAGLEGGEDPGAATPPNYALNGVLGQMLYDAITQARKASRNRKAIETVSPLVPALEGFDANEVLRASVQQALADVAWLRLAGMTRLSAAKGPDNTPTTEVRDAPFTGLMSCAYMLSGELDSVYASCDNSIYQTGVDAGTGAKGPASPGKQVHFRRTEVQVGLAQYAADNEGRKAQWLANAATPLKRALTLALTRVAQLSAKALAQSPGNFDAYRQARKMNMGQYIDTHGGELVEGADNLLNSHESCFNRKNKSSVKVGSEGLVLEEEDGSMYRCMGFSVP